MSVVFAPFYFADAQGIDGVAAVLTRLAPFKRGLFEVRVYFDSRTGNLSDVPCVLCAGLRRQLLVRHVAYGQMETALDGVSVREAGGNHHALRHGPGGVPADSKAE